MTISTNTQQQAANILPAPVIKKLDLPGLYTPLRGVVDRVFDLSQLHKINPERYPFLLESVAKSTEAGLGQFDILFAYPQQTFQLDDLTKAQQFVEQVQAEFEQKVGVFDGFSTKLPFTGGWFAYFSYDYAEVVEPILNLPQAEFPLANLTRVPVAVVIDHVDNSIYIIAEAAFADCIATIESDIKTCLAEPESSEPQPIVVTKAEEEPEQKYLDGVEAIKEYILAGDVFQANLSRQWQVELQENTAYIDVYRALRKSNPAPFAALANFNSPDTTKDLAWQIISSSPERLVKYQAPWVETRPIAGTRKRGTDDAADKALIEELIAHPKERAEHIMLIDLERNDLGRICQPGSVEVNELMVIETYEHVHHIVSNVRGKLQPGLSPLDIIHALFPGGTITGCPKIRCMEIIAELEQMPREAYTGSLGYINLDGSLDLNILIRTMLQFEKQGKPIVQFRAGAGIVADSKASHELTESRHKAKGLVKALEAGNA